MTSSQQYGSPTNARNVQYGRVSGANNNAFDFHPQHQAPEDNNNTTALHPDFLPSVDDADADASTTTAAPTMDAHTGIVTGGGAAMTSVCHTCNRTFKRRCDLNRHRRTHTRPFKCAIPACEYSKRGFPTSQERQRHMDDRHSDKPPTFHCYFKACKYSSKRESNCKQHMEKTHGWQYDRSRQTNNNRADNDNHDNDEEDEEEEDVATVVAPGAIAPSSTLTPSPFPISVVEEYAAPAPLSPLSPLMGEVDFILYPEQQQQQQQAASVMLGASLVGGNGSVVYTNDSTNAVAAAAEAVSNAFVPWESPLTQQEEISNLIRSAVHRFDPQPLPLTSQPREQSVYPKSIGWFTPANYHVAQAPLPLCTAAGAAEYSSPATPNFVGTPHFPPQQHSVAYSSSAPHTPLVQAPTTPAIGGLPQPIASISQAWPTLIPTTSAANQQLLAKQSAALLQIQAHAQAHTHAHAHAHAHANNDETACYSAANASPTSAPHQVSSLAEHVDRGIKRDRDADSDDDGDDDDDENSRPPKHPKTSHNDAVDEDHMPCPYHKNDPAYFYRGNEERFSPCHTQHKYISTLFRHLGRAAHNLIITENSASSFGIEEENKPQPQAGLCRRCWTAFRDEDEFKAHVVVGQQCARASRSKREKYSLILETFCSPPNDDTGSSPTPASMPLPMPIPTPTPTPMPSGPALQPAAPIESDMDLPPRPDSTKVVAQAPPDQETAESPHIKVSPSQAHPKANVLTQGGHKHHASIGSATLVDAEYYVSRSEFQGFAQSFVQRLGDLEALVKRFGEPTVPRLQIGSIPNLNRGGPLPSLGQVGPGLTRSATIQTDASAHERGSLVREMDRQTILEEDDEDDRGNAADSSNDPAAGRSNGDPNGQQSSSSGGLNEAGGSSADASQMLAGIGEPLRTLSGLSSSSNASSVRHVPPPALVPEDTRRRLRQQRREQHEDEEEQKRQGEFAAGGGGSQHQHQQHPEQGGRQQRLRQVKRQQHEEAETLPDTAPETVADSGYASNEVRTTSFPYNPHDDAGLAAVVGGATGTMAAMSVVHDASFSSILSLTKGQSGQQDQRANNPGNDVEDIDDGVQPPSMFDNELRGDFDEADVLW